jgi:hypothetical protein
MGTMVWMPGSAVEARRLRDRLFASLSPATLFTCFN